MEDQKIVVLIFTAASILIMVLGTAIWKWEIAEIVAGYDPKKIPDKAGWTKMVGSTLLLLGLVGLFHSFLMLLIPSVINFLGPSFLLVIIAFIIKINLTSRSFIKRNVSN